MRDYLQNLSLPQKLLLANAGLFVVIAILAALLIADTRTLPAEPERDRIEEQIRRVSEENVEIRSRDTLYPNFGRNDLFASLIPTPTPSPTPVPTPPPDPKLAEAIGHWKAPIVSRSRILIEDPRRNDEWWIRPEDPSTHTKVIRHGNEEMEIRFKSQERVEVTFEYAGRNEGPQSFTLSMFDD